jgi:superoxide reductase
MFNERRTFLKSFAGLSAAGVATALLPTAASASSMLNGIVYTRGSPGRWSGKVESHLPQVVVQGGLAFVETPHGMSPGHYIVRHTLATAAGEVVGEQTFAPSDPRALSQFQLPPGERSFYVTSFCNLHDLWVSAFTV